MDDLNTQNLGAGMRHFAALFLVAMVVCLPWSSADAGVLASDPSPYLRMHADDPVAWRPLDADALAEARTQDRLIFVTVGYFSCYWCHVMQGESFVDPEVAKRLNADYIPTVVDRELSPAIDAALIEFVERTRGMGGWPLNVVLTPDGLPLIGTTYLPRAQFLELLERVMGLWNEERAQLEQAAAAGAELLARRPVTMDADLDPRRGSAYQALLVDVALRLADTLAGGFGDQGKFPNAPQLLALLAVQGAEPRRELEEFLRLTLDSMADLGLRDHLGGGFFRYTTDPQWQVPHFEKMLYDNAQLALVYLEAARVFAEPRYRALAFETLDFVLRDLALGNGRFASSLSSVDAAGAEGAAYLWDDATLARLLDADQLAVARLAWGLHGDSAFPEGYLPIRRRDVADIASRLNREPSVVTAQRVSARAILLQARMAERQVPRDDKALSGWNGLLLEALASAVSAPGGSRYRVPGRALRDYLATVAWQDDALASLVHADGRVTAEVGDYAHVAGGLLAWARVDGGRDDERTARAVAAVGFARHFSVNGWFGAEQPLFPFMGRDAAFPDGALRSPSALLAGTALALAASDPDWEARARMAMNVPDDVLLTEPFWHATLITGLNLVAARPNAEAVEAR